MELLTNEDSGQALIKTVSELQDNNLQKLTNAINVEKMQRIVGLMHSNLNNKSEEFWQNFFTDNQWVLSQVYASPYTIFGEKVYVGGKSVCNNGGNVCDFVFKNELSNNISLIEIKTPCTSLIGTEYRHTFPMSRELSGAVNQVLNYKDTLTKEYYSLCANGDTGFKVFSPKCIIVIGRINTLNDNQISAFEHFRNSLNNVSIITFDGICNRLHGLVSLLTTETGINGSYEPVNDDIPF